MPACAVAIDSPEGSRLLRNTSRRTIGRTIGAPATISPPTERHESAARRCLDRRNREDVLGLLHG